MSEAPRGGEVIRVVVVDDDRVLCHELQRLLGSAAGIAVAGVFHDADTALAALVAAQLPADVALVDLDLGTSTGIHVLRELARARPELTCVAFTVASDDATVFEVLRAGACGYLLKGIEGARLVASIVEATRGGSPMSPGVARRVLAWLRDGRVPAPAPRPVEALSARETAVLERLARGASYAMVARELGIGLGTVQGHVKSIYRKLHISSKAEAAAEAYRRGLVG